MSGNVEEELEEPAPGMSAAQQKLFALRMKINKGRKENKDEVEKEFRRLTDPSYESNVRLADAYETKVKEGKVLSKQDSLLHETAESAERIAEKNRTKEKHKATFGWQSFTSEASFRAYEKRLPRIPKREFAETTEAPAMNPLDYGRVNTEVAADGIERLTRDIEDRLASRKTSSRRRQTFESSTVDSINQKNEFFNKKIKRSFDKYTVEIRQNLERGTAI